MVWGLRSCNWFSLIAQGWEADQSAQRRVKRLTYIGLKRLEYFLPKKREFFNFEKYFEVQKKLFLKTKKILLCTYYVKGFSMILNMTQELLFKLLQYMLIKKMLVVKFF